MRMTIVVTECSAILTGVCFIPDTFEMTSAGGTAGRATTMARTVNSILLSTGPVFPYIPTNREIPRVRANTSIEVFLFPIETDMSRLLLFGMINAYND